MKKLYIFTIFLAIFFGFFAVSFVKAYTVEDLNLQNSGSMIVGPGKTEIELAPGETYNMNVTAANATGMTKIINFSPRIWVLQIIQILLCNF